MSQVDFHAFVPEHGSYHARKLIEEMRLVHKGSIELEELPVKRSVIGIINGKADFYYPILKPLNNVKKKFDYDISSVTVSSVIYAVYVHKSNKNIQVHNLQDFTIEGENGHTDFFDFKVHSSSCVRCSFLKVDQGRIDGYIYPAVWGDEIIKSLKLKNVESYYFDTYELKFALPKGQRGKSPDRTLSDLIKKMKSTGSYHKIFKQMDESNKSWKPVRGYF